MKVRAVMRGFYLWLRQVGEEFEIPDHLHAPLKPGTQDGGWQEKVEDPVPELPPPVAEPANAPVEPAAPVPDVVAAPAADVETPAPRFDDEHGIDPPSDPLPIKDPL